MTPPDFTAAEERVLARRQRKIKSELRSSPLSASSQLNRLPPPLKSIGQQGISAWDVIKGRDGTRPSFRVGQIDAELLDEELLELLKGQVGDGLKLFGAHIKDRWSSEISLILRALLFKFTIWDHNASYGAALQNLRYTDARQEGPVAALPSRWQKSIHGLFAVGGRYAWARWENWLTEHEGSHEEPGPNFPLLSKLSSFVSTTYSISAFISFLVFLLNGRYRTLVDRVLRLRLTSSASKASREVSFEYLNRQLVWHAFTEFLLFLLPLVGISRWRRWLSKAWRKTKATIQMGSVDGTEESSEKGELAFLPERTCAICHQDQNPIAGSENEVMAITGTSGGIIGSAQTDVTNPYQTIPCSCVFCFVCIAKRLEGEDGEGWICLRCGTLVKECCPWNGDVIEKVSTPTTQKTVDLSDEEDEQPDKLKERVITKDHESMHDAGFNDMGNTVDPVLSNENFGSQEWAQQGSDEPKSH